MNTPTTEEILAKNSFAQMLSALNRGRVLTECSEELALVVAAVIKTGKPGEVTLKLKIRPNADGETVAIEAPVEKKLPRPDRKSTNFFTGENGELLRDDPKQKELGFEVSDGGASDFHSLPSDQTGLSQSAMAANG